MPGPGSGVEAPLLPHLNTLTLNDKQAQLLVSGVQVGLDLIIRNEVDWPMIALKLELCAIDQDELPGLVKKLKELSQASAESLGIL